MPIVSKSRPFGVRLHLHLSNILSAAVLVLVVEHNKRAGRMYTIVYRAACLPS